ncbi:hypothetical protein EPA93_08405 [Ktedonosporobacter rubrisoli]|uniref:Uncharacterized protein n=1 Tax=Ktedonosporobacter rubrisoli TaxID=2509675 RepID=A0A4P6JLF7_KTERU|nr:hypothetical protein [Ktedonosporobacter rubrisoli]QBD76025.1 hypothetical protein EPA93_08405 [Ktedonosporobacter rubrisoli]
MRRTEAMSNHTFGLKLIGSGNVSEYSTSDLPRIMSAEFTRTVCDHLHLERILSLSLAFLFKIEGNFALLQAKSVHFHVNTMSKQVAFTTRMGLISPGMITLKRARLEKFFLTLLCYAHSAWSTRELIMQKTKKRGTITPMESNEALPHQVKETRKSETGAPLFNRLIPNPLRGRP